MSDIPLFVLIFYVAISFTLPVIGYLFRTKFPVSFLLFISGAIFIFIFWNTDNITLGQLASAQTYDNTTNTINNEYTPDNFNLKDDVTGEPNMISLSFLMAGISIVLVGVLIETGRFT